jgi:hypothetical protein
MPWSGGNADQFMKGIEVAANHGDASLQQHVTAGGATRQDNQQWGRVFVCRF